jgi:hypothetical protein
MTCRVFDINVNQSSVDESFKNQTWNTSISFSNNTMLNVPTPVGYVRAYKVKNVKINKNICAVQDGYDGYSGYLIYLYDWDQSDKVEIIKDGNLFYGLAKVPVPGKDNAYANWNIANSSSAWRPDKNANPTFNQNPDRL